MVGQNDHEADTYAGEQSRGLPAEGSTNPNAVEPAGAAEDTTPASLQALSDRANQAVAQHVVAQEVPQDKALRLSMHATLDAIRVHSSRAEVAMMEVQASDE